MSRLDEFSAKLDFLRNLVADVESGKQPLREGVSKEEALSQLRQQIVEGEQLLREYAPKIAVRN